MQKMDDKNSSVISKNVGMENIASSRDENKSPTSGSSSDALGDDGLNRKESNRKQRRRQSKVKRKWKPYTDLSWDERKKQDDRESRRAFAKRERLSAEGHPIAPYNTTQFLMDDHKPSANQGGKEESATLRKLAPTDSSTSLQSLDTGTSSIMNTEGTFVMEHKRARFYANSPHPSELGTQGEGGAECRDDIQRYILNDFSQTYAGIHAEELQSMSQMDLIAECLKLEKRVDVLERRVKKCREKHRDEPRNQADVRLLEKINQLQVLNSQLQKDNASIQSPRRDKAIPTDSTSNDGAPTDTSSTSVQPQV